MSHSRFTPNLELKLSKQQVIVQALGGREVGLDYVKLSHIRLSMVRSWLSGLGVIGIFCSF